MSPQPSFETLSEIGRGADSFVFRALALGPVGDLEPGAEIALKRLVDPDDPAARRALEREYRTARRIQHPAVVRAHAFGADENGPYLALDLLPGPSLAEELRREGRLAEHRVRRIGARLADALSALAELGYLHNDLKPENVLLDERGRAVLIDLGLAVRRGASHEETAGSLAYFAPERLHGGLADSASDVFALGVLLYEIATGQHPFVPPGAEPAASIAAIDRALCDLPSRRAPQLSPLFDELVSELLARRPSDRPRAKEIAQRLRAGEGSAWWRRRPRDDYGARWGIGERFELVGRDTELTELMRYWNRVHVSDERAPRSGLALLTGSAGTGKVRLAGEFAVRARREGHPPAYLFARWSPASTSRPAGALSAVNARDEVRDIVQRYQLRAKKRLGQNFLVDGDALDEIARRATSEVPGVIEIGPGPGTLTRRLAESGLPVVAIEKDETLVEMLRQELASFDNVRIVHGDALDGELASHLETIERPAVVGNIPYNISSPLLIRLVEQRASLGRVTLLMQKEVVDRLVAEPGNKTYGRLTVMLRLHAIVDRGRSVPPDAFWPAPKVHSCVVHWRWRSSPAVAVTDPLHFERVVRAAFSQRRKMLRNALLTAFTKSEVERVAAGGFDLGQRAERLSLEDFARLAMALER